LAKWTISDIAVEARVSKTTVSRVLNGRPDVDAETSARVLSIVDKVGYVRSSKAVQLAQGRNNAIGLLAPFDTTPWLFEVLRGAMNQVQATHFSLSIHAFPDSAAELERLVAQLRGGSMDGLLVVSLQHSLPILAEVAADGLPVVMLNDYGCNDGLPDVVPDETLGIADAVQHLVDIGRKSFAIVTGPDNNPVSVPRLDAYRAALSTHGITLDERLIVAADFTEPGARAATDILSARGVPFDALFASSDAMAVGAMRSLKRAGRHIPRDISVIGFDDFEPAEFTEPRLTTVHNPLYEMSVRAVTRLLAAITEGLPLAAGEEVVRTHLTIRDSSDPRRGA
jgi:LacI family transcriptional regulator